MRGTPGSPRVKRTTEPGRASAAGTLGKGKETTTKKINKKFKNKKKKIRDTRGTKEKFSRPCFSNFFFFPLLFFRDAKSEPGYQGHHSFAGVPGAPPLCRGTRGTTCHLRPPALLLLAVLLGA